MKIKKILLSLCALATSIGLMADDRSQTLKVYNWADYIDEDLIGEFESWYEQQTGQKVKIIYDVFDVNEVMLSKIEKGKEDYDVVCPSDYMVEKMLKADLLLPIDRNFGSTPDYIGNIAPYLQAMLKTADAPGKDVTKYAVPYMWGTIGLCYNTQYVTKEEASTWEALRNPKFSGQIFMKNAFRDVYTCILMYLKADKIKSGELTPDQVSRDTSPESIKLVEDWLSSMTDGLIGWEDAYGADQMAKGKGWIGMQWSGDAQFAIDQGALAGVKLDYAIPKDGRVIFYDAWVIPKYAKNVKAASYFINYMCTHENAVRNMDVSGYVSAVGGEDILREVEDSTKWAPVDASYFFGEAGKKAHVNPIRYPDASSLEHSAIMHDTGDSTEALNDMWSRVRGDNAGALTYIILGIAILALIAFAIYRMNSKKNKHGKKRR